MIPTKFCEIVDYLIGQVFSYSHIQNQQLRKLSGKEGDEDSEGNFSYFLNNQTLSKLTNQEMGLTMVLDVLIYVSYAYSYSTTVFLKRDQ